MGQSYNKLFRKLCGEEETRILMVGFDNSGKTTLLYKLKLGEIIETLPTIDFNIETIQLEKNINLTIWDLSSTKILCNQYYQNTLGLIYVLDSTDRDRINQVKEKLELMLRESDLRCAPLLVLNNKVDLDEKSMKDQEVIEKLDLSSLCNRKWYIKSTSALTGQGLYEGLEWLTNAIRGKV